MLVLPGLDGSGLTAWAQFPELARDYDLRALAIGADDRSSYADLVGTVSDELASAQAAGREVLLFGESMGAGGWQFLSIPTPDIFAGFAHCMLEATKVLERR